MVKVGECGYPMEGGDRIIKMEDSLTREAAFVAKRFSLQSASEKL